MNKPISFRELTIMFLNGATSGRAGTKTNPGNLRIAGDQLIHYETPILERYKDGYLLNRSRYSIQTGRLQKMLLRELLIGEKVINVVRVEMNHSGSLLDYAHDRTFHLVENEESQL